MDVQQAIGDAEQALEAHRVFGEPVRIDGGTLVPAAIVRCRAGGAQRRGSDGAAGFRFTAKPAGALVLRNGKVNWLPATDVNRIILGGQLVAVTALVAFSPLVRGWVARARTRRRMRRVRRWLGR